jgi:type IV pilus assembly protein PilF
MRRALLPERSWPRLAALALALATALAGCKTTTTVTTTSDSAQAAGAKSEGDPHKRAEVRVQLASGYYRKGLVDVALKEATDATQIDPGYAPAYGLLGLIYMDLGQNHQAEDSFRRALQLDPNDPEQNNNFGWFLCRTHHERDALPYFDRAAANKLYPTPAMALQNAGICLKQAGDGQRAEQYLVRALEADATSPVAKFQLALLYLQTHRADRAEFYYELLAKSVDPNPQTLWLGTRIAHARSDSLNQQRLAQELRTRFPESAEARLLNRGAFDE